LRAAKRELALDNLEAYAERLDDFWQREPIAADVAISRATWALPEWLERGLSVVHPGGTVLGMEAKECEIPERARRHPYPQGSRTRAIITLQRTE
jgi:16S rRNA G527 N7-methylase RsmG